MEKEELEILKQRIRKLAKKYDLSLVLLYGSQAKGKIRKDSDIDIAVLGKRMQVKGIALKL